MVSNILCASKPELVLDGWIFSSSFFPVLTVFFSSHILSCDLEKQRKEELWVKEKSLINDPSLFSALSFHFCGGSWWNKNQNVCNPWKKKKVIPHWINGLMECTVWQGSSPSKQNLLLSFFFLKKSENMLKQLFFFTAIETVETGFLLYCLMVTWNYRIEIFFLSNIKGPACNI